MTGPNEGYPQDQRQSICLCVNARGTCRAIRKPFAFVVAAHAVEVTRVELVDNHGAEKLPERRVVLRGSHDCDERCTVDRSGGDERCCRWS